MVAAYQGAFMSELIPPSVFYKLDTRDTTSVVTTYYAAYRGYENGKGGKAVLFTLNRDFDSQVVKAKVLFVIDVAKDQSVRSYVSERIADVIADEVLPGKPDFQEVDTGSYDQIFAFLGDMLEMQ
jgi:hypothetical protein